MIVVTAPTSQIGSKVVDGPLAAGASLRLVARDAARLPQAVRDRTEVVEGSHGDAAVLARAFEGADAVFWLVPLDATKTLEQAWPRGALPTDHVRPVQEAVPRSRRK